MPPSQSDPLNLRNTFAVLFLFAHLFGENTIGPRGRIVVSSNPKEVEGLVTNLGVYEDFLVGSA